MLKTKRVKYFHSEVYAIICDKCGKEITPDDPMEYQEVFHVDLVGGYSSVFGDEAEVKADLCQQCLKELIAPFCRVDGKTIKGG